MTDTTAPARETVNRIDLLHLRDHVIRPTLAFLQQADGVPGWQGPVPERLLIGTVLAESRGRSLVQLGNGPARGLYQMEPATHDDIWQTYLLFREPLFDAVSSLRMGSVPIVNTVRADEMIGNLYYATAMARIRYRRARPALPALDDIDGLGRYWKDHYNTRLGKGDASKFTSLLRTAVDRYGV